MNITINGENHQVSDAHTLSSLLVDLGFDIQKVAVEKNLEIVPKSTFDQARITEGDKLEIVHFIGGG